VSAPIFEEWLGVGDGHAIRIENYGDPEGTPALFLHGGPGSGCQPGHRALFDPARVRAIFVDQRGAGRSLPRRARHANTTDHLVADLERVRRHLGSDRWLVIGGSWGATLALAYAEAHPGQVAGLVLRAVFLGTRAELDWAFGPALARFHPALHADFLGLLPPEERGAPLDAYWRRILDPDPAVHAPAAWAWHDTERALSELLPASARLRPHPEGGPLPATPFMEAHYFLHDCFLAPGQLLANAGRLAGIPGRIVQGRYDLLCAPSTSQALADAWDGARLEIIEGAGHSLAHPGVHEAVRLAIAELAGTPGVGALTNAADGPPPAARCP
jgi:proline iminopeptidase